MRANRGLTRRLGRDLLLQAVYISAAVLLGVFIAANLIPDLMIREALEEEADYYWTRIQGNPLHPLPDTLNLTAYREGFADGVPGDLAALSPGYHHRDEARETLTFVSERDGQRLYLVFEVAQVNRLLILFGLIPLALALTVVYLALYSGYRVSRRAVSPVVALAGQVRELDPATPHAPLLSLDRPPDADAEIQVLYDALQGLVSRVTAFAERERQFTRDTSHELRTPLTVIRMAVDQMMRDGEFTDDQTESLQRIRKSAADMEALTEAFLLLARESAESLPQEWVCVNDLVEAELERARIIRPDSAIGTDVEAECRLSVHANEKVLASVIGNLLRNALCYTDAGMVRVRIGPDSVTIEDTGPGMAPGEVEQAFKPWSRGGRRRGGFGVGLTIVKRFSERFEWPLVVDSEPSRGTRVKVRFPDARFEDLRTD